MSIYKGSQILAGTPLPDQNGQSGKFLTTDGTEASWGTVDALPAQSGQSGKYLTTNGSTASWQSVDALPSQSGQSGKYLTTDGTTASWEEIPTEVDGETISLNSSDEMQAIGVIDTNASRSSTRNFTTVGSPTITDDGIASGFSSGNYLYCRPTYTVNNKIRYEMSLDTPATLPTSSSTSEDTYCLFRVYNNASGSWNTNAMIIKGSDNTLRYQIADQVKPQILTFQPSKHYDLYFEIDTSGNVNYGYSIDGVLTTGTTTGGYAMSTAGGYIGIGCGMHVDGTLVYGYSAYPIDLKSFLITVDDKEAYRAWTPELKYWTGTKSQYDNIGTYYAYTYSTTTLYVRTDAPTTSSTVYSAVGTASALTITAIGTNYTTLTLSDGNTYDRDSVEDTVDSTQYSNNTLYNITDDTDVTLTVLQTMYPVGSIYITTNSTCPLSALFGTWVLQSDDIPNCVIETGNSNGIYYRIWQDGYCEQWGVLNIDTATSWTTVSLIKTYSTTDYNIVAVDSGTSTNFHYWKVGGTKNENSFQIINNTATTSVYWKASGYLASDQYTPKTQSTKTFKRTA